MAGSRNQLRNNGLGSSPPAVAHYLPTNICKTEPELNLVASRWDRLPEAIRVRIVAMVKASVPSTEIGPDDDQRRE
jgi:hypothetical protein